MADFYFYSCGATRKGLITFNELKSLAFKGVIDRQAKVWAKGMERWDVAVSIAGLFDDLPPEIPEERLKTEPAKINYGTVRTGVGAIPTAGNSISGWLFIIGGGVLTALLAIELFNMRGHVAAPFAAAGCWAGKCLKQKLDGDA